MLCSPTRGILRAGPTPRRTLPYVVPKERNIAVLFEEQCARRDVVGVALSVPRQPNRRAVALLRDCMRTRSPPGNVGEQWNNLPHKADRASAVLAYLRTHLV